MCISDREVEIIKAYSVLWRTSPDCCPYLDESKGNEHHMNTNDPADFLRLSEEDQKHLVEWIDYALEAEEIYICPDNSYAIKHIYERDTGKYVTNGQFKGAMVRYGLDPVDPSEVNCHYRMKVRYYALENQENA